MTPAPQVTVVVRTHASPERLVLCLEHLAALRTAPHEIIVVDAAPGAASHQLIAEKFPEVTYLSSHTAPASSSARQVGLSRASGEIVSFLDDDVCVDDLWLDALLAPYSDATVAAVGGRVVSGSLGADRDGIGSIGRLLPSGEMTSFFGARPAHPVAVDHLSGANMSFRASALASLGGFRRGPGETDHLEAADLALRLRGAGHRLVFTPHALARRDAGPDTDRARVDLRHLHSTRRDHVLLLARALGWSHPLVLRYPITTVRDQHRHLRAAYQLLRGRPDSRGARPSIARRLTWPLILTRSAAELTGLAAGFPAALRARRHDAADTGLP